MNGYLQVLNKYAVFKDRARRREYWFFILFNVIFGTALVFIDQKMGSFVASADFGVLSALYTLAVMIPGVAVSIRRLHDTGRSGWWFLITIVPILGFCVFLYFMALDSDPGTNKYGHHQKVIS
jgi:uncharacterized membrane protein YhaH (DUF805 family)